MLLGETTQVGEDLPEGHPTEHHLLEQALSVLVVVEVADLVPGDPVGCLDVGEELGGVTDDAGARASEASAKSSCIVPSYSVRRAVTRSPSGRRPSRK